METATAHLAIDSALSAFADQGGATSDRERLSVLALILAQQALEKHAPPAG